MRLPISPASSDSARRPAGGWTSSRRRRRIRPGLESLERRLVLSSETFTWTGLDDGTSWSDAKNWLGDAVPPAGSAVVFPAVDSETTSSGVLYPPNGTIAIDTADVSSMTVEGTYVFQGANSGFPQGALTLDANASIVISNPSATVTFQQGLQMNFPGSTTVSFTGNGSGAPSIDLLTQQIEYPGASGLRPIKIGGKGTMTLGSTTTLLGWNLNVAAGSTIRVPGEVQPHIGSLSGDGEVNEGPPSAFESTQLSINPPSGESDEFDGVIDGSGGIVSMDSGNAAQNQGAGTQIIGSINPTGSGEFQLQINSGTMLVNDAVNAQTLNVASGASFGGPATMTFTGDPSNPGANPDVTFNTGATFAVALNGTPASGDFTQVTDTDDDVDSSPPQSTVQLDGSDLSVSLGAGSVHGRRQLHDHLHAKRHDRRQFRKLGRRRRRSSWTASH